MTARCHSCGAEQRIGHRCQDDPCEKCGGVRYQQTLSSIESALGTGWLVGREPCETCSRPLQKEKGP